jgi:hypothetical protein
VSHATSQAIALLLRNEHPRVKLLLDDQRLLIEPAAAIVRLKRNDYTVCSNSHRVKWIRLNSVSAKWQHCWRVDKAVVLEPGLEWGS